MGYGGVKRGTGLLFGHGGEACGGVDMRFVVWLTISTGCGCPSMKNVYGMKHSLAVASTPPSPLTNDVHEEDGHVLVHSGQTPELGWHRVYPIHGEEVDNMPDGEEQERESYR